MKTDHTMLKFQVYMMSLGALIRGDRSVCTKIKRESYVAVVDE